MKYTISYNTYNTQKGTEEGGTLKQTTNKLYQAKLVAERNLGRINWEGGDPVSGCIGEARCGFETTLVSICPSAA